MATQGSKERGPGDTISLFITMTIIALVRTSHQGWPTVKGRGVRHHCFMGGVPKNL